MKDDSAQAAQDTSATGCVLGGRYRVGALIRSGGMGSVYEGEHMSTGRRVALKLVHVLGRVVADVEHRFEREARIASNIQSKHIVQVFDAGRDEALGPFMAMELLHGDDLEERLARIGPLPPRTACEVAFQAARGLEKAHAVNIAHRDLKPGNIFLVDSDEEDFLVKVLDFGIAKLFDDPPEANAKLTRAGTALGTPQYMSPEQARGEVDIDARTDVYSLGAVLYEMLVGRSHVPDLPNYNQLVIHIATVEAPRVAHAVPEIDPRIDRLVADMLVGDRRDRIQTMRAIRERLAPILGSAVRLGGAGDASGSFSASRVASSPGFSSARLLVAAPAFADADDADSEEVHFFERESFASVPAAPAVEPPSSGARSPESDDGEKVELFERASLHLRAAAERSSSSAHVIDDPRRSSERNAVWGGASEEEFRRAETVDDVWPPPEAAAWRISASEPEPVHDTIVSDSPAFASIEPRTPPPRRGRRRALFAAAGVTVVFLALGSVRLARAPVAGAGAAPAAAGAPLESAPLPAATTVDPVVVSPEAVDASVRATP
jgi:serine/threonine protein kinase